jgi:hypothetical protein
LFDFAVQLKSAYFAALLACVAGASACVSPPTRAASGPLPIADGDYKFEHRFAEHPSLHSVTMDVRIRDGRIVITNTTPSSAFPVGVVAEGRLLWNGRVGQWIIADKEADRNATEVGGCTDGPEVVDLEHRVYWTC